MRIGQIRGRVHAGDLKENNFSSWSTGAGRVVFSDGISGKPAR